MLLLSWGDVRGRLSNLYLASSNIECFLASAGKVETLKRAQKAFFYCRWIYNVVLLQQRFNDVFTLGVIYGRVVVDEYRPLSEPLTKLYNLLTAVKRAVVNKLLLKLL